MKKCQRGYQKAVNNRRNRYVQALRLPVMAVGSCLGLIAVFVGWILHADEGVLAQTAVAVPLLVYSIWLYGEIFFGRGNGSHAREQDVPVQSEGKEKLESIDWNFELDASKSTLDFFRTTIRLSGAHARGSEQFGARPSRVQDQQSKASRGQ